MRTIILSLILLLLFSCGRESQLFYTENSEEFSTCMLSNKFTVFCYLDSTDCTVCSMSWLHRWSYFENDLKKMNTNVALIVRSSDKNAVFDAMLQLRLDFPVIFDSTLAIMRDNPEVLSQYAAFAVNRKKEVVWKGLPIENKASWDAFRKSIRRMSRFELFGNM